jgi:hypothetical protein
MVKATVYASEICKCLVCLAFFSQRCRRGTGVPGIVAAFFGCWCRKRDSNPRPPHYECGALPTELLRLSKDLAAS